MAGDELRTNFTTYFAVASIIGIIVLIQFLPADYKTDEVVEKYFFNLDDRDLEHFKAPTEEMETNPRCAQELKVLNERISHLEKINFDKLGPPDYAARMFGGEVVSVASTSRKYNTVLKKIENMFSTLLEGDEQKQCIIQDCGTCYALPGSSGYIVLKLVGKVFLGAITIEHIPLYSSPYQKQVNSALKKFSVVGMNELGARGSETHFGTFVFDYEKDFLETFSLNSVRGSPSVRYVRVEIHSNYGENYTCVYRLRIHGTLDQ